MAIKGNLKEASLADVCQLLALGQKTGCLDIADRVRFGQIYLQNGRITFSRILKRRDRIGEYLLRENLITPAQLRAALEDQARNPAIRLGQVLIALGSISSVELERVLRSQIEHSIHQLFTWTQGSFFFEPGKTPADTEFLVSINPESLLLEAARRVDEWSVIEKKIPSFDVVYRPNAAQAPDVLAELTADQQCVLEQLDGTRSLGEVVQRTSLSEYEVGKALLGLVQAGVVTQAAKLETVPAAARFASALRALRQHRYEEALGRLESMLSDLGPHFGICLNLALTLRRLGRPTEALRILDQAEQTRAGSPLVALARGATLLEAGQVEGALANLNEYRRRLPAAHRPACTYFYYAGLAEALVERLAQAEAIVMEGLEQFPCAAPLLLLAGLIAERKQEPLLAEQHFRQAIAEDASLVQAYKSLGDIYYARGSHDRALEQYERALQLDPALGDDIYARLGNILYQKRGRRDALRLWKRAVELNPENQLVRKHIETARDAN